MKSFCFTIDDNIRFLKELEQASYDSIFDHPYVAMLLRLHKKFGIKVQLNLFYSMAGFDLSQASDRYSDEWKENSDWIKFSFHSREENSCPYKDAGYDEVFKDCSAVNEQIRRIASSESLARTTTIHYCRTTAEGLSALRDNGVVGLLGLFGNEEQPRTSYEINEAVASKIRCGELVAFDGVTFASIDVIVNTVKLENIIPIMTKYLMRDSIRVMIHEQYFYEDYKSYQMDFEEKLDRIFGLLCNHGFESCFFEDLIQ